MKKNAKIMKRSHAYKAYASSYNIDVLNSLILTILNALNGERK